MAREPLDFVPDRRVATSAIPTIVDLMSTHLFRFTLVLATLLSSSFALALRAQTGSTPALPPAALSPAPATTPPTGEPQDTTEAKMAVVLRSYTLLQAENDQLKAEKEKLLADKSLLESQLGVAKNALPLADQAAAFHEQLRQTQDQLAALSLENNQLKTRLSMVGNPSGSTMSSPTYPGTPAAAIATAPAAAPVAATPAASVARTHVIAEGDTLAKISRQYYGTPNRWSEILSANRDVLHDEKSLVIGRTLKIP
ncbi:MAG: Peptidoglycan-binding LysM [Verrucomicrobia bacterium]|nr:Peptidoglycan-binding LysM [Verrucomicrobiota bacterium]